jgi:peptidoglycan/xylan/chitin deacetylase (PgdA/CDA1 family)
MLERVRRASRRLAARLAGAPAILAYHRVATVPRDPYGLCLSPAEFEKQVRRLARTRRPARLSRLLEAWGNGTLVRGAVVVTFDDGYADNAAAALRILERYEVPATMFIAAGYVGTGREFWWDELERVAYHSRAESLMEVIEDSAVWSSGGPDADSLRTSRSPPALLRTLWNVVLPLPPRERDALIGNLLTAAGIPTSTRDSHAILDERALQRLAAHPLIDIASHGMSHTMLSALSYDEQHAELVTSRAVLESLSGRPVRDFSYPFGFRSSWTVDTETALRASGFRSACTTVRGRVLETADLFQLPREMVGRPDGS